MRFFRRKWLFKQYEDMTEAEQEECEKIAKMVGCVWSAVVLTIVFGYLIQRFL
jgi:hypothetical protein